MHSRTRWLALITLVAMAASLPLYATEDDHEVVELARGVYAWVWTAPLDQPVEGNSLFIINESDVVIVDSGLFPSTARRMIAELRRHTDNPVRYVINTHWHDDHHGGNAVYLEEWPGAEIIAHPLTRDDIIEQTYAERPGVIASYRKQIETLDRWLAAGHDDEGTPVDDSRRERYESALEILERVVDELDPLVPAPPTLLVSDQLTLKRGDRTIDVRWLGKGNTRGDLVVVLPAEKIVATGDLLVRPVPFGIGSNYREWIDTLDALDEIDADILVPGHGAPMRDRNYLGTVRHLLQDLVDGVAAAVADGLTLEETRAAVTLAQWRAELAGDDPVRQRAFDDYFLGPAVKRAWEIENGVAKDAEGLY